ncbi:DDE-type integrase/transposase/recombinase [Streptomyces sp. NBC_00047]|uniref:DDE-type integrase/transposase/recombinase n=1 Tax=Streptomyces sp. NBC_00047 TaxID=2975627 RepID=UPI00224F35A5|nr:DDE-type integrase/transposase/recombinase [Streptomyces sp. NBC_00047]MCX5610894.1 DDE-type integrase/transposase/recombinase [Streptomyces sp. NBC_00047]
MTRFQFVVDHQRRHGVKRLCTILGIARLTQAIGVTGFRLRRRHRTTIADAAKDPDLMGPNFTANTPNAQARPGDIAYLAVGDGRFRYLAPAIDPASHRLAGWALADHMHTELVIDALHAAKRTHGSLNGAILHTDHGAQPGAGRPPPLRLGHRSPTTSSSTNRQLRCREPHRPVSRTWGQGPM